MTKSDKTNLPELEEDFKSNSRYTVFLTGSLEDLKGILDDNNFTWNKPIDRGQLTIKCENPVFKKNSKIDGVNIFDFLKIPAGIITKNETTDVFNKKNPPIDADEDEHLLITTFNTHEMAKLFVLSTSFIRLRENKDAKSNVIYNITDGKRNLGFILLSDDLSIEHDSKKGVV